MPSFQLLGDQAVLASFPDEPAALGWSAALRQTAPAWLLDVVGAYTRVAVYFDLSRTTGPAVVDALQELVPLALPVAGAPREHTIPCCYEQAPDLERVARHTGMASSEVIRLHTSTTYTVFAIGFCPGFPYLGYLPAKLCGVPRLSSPRLWVDAGSVALAGRQTGIYTMPRPGGWSVIGRTPLELVDVSAEYFPLRTGDHVRFVPINEDELRRLHGQRLPGDQRPLPHSDILSSQRTR